MGLETGDFINDLVTTNPASNDLKSQGDDHLRLIKKVLKQTLNGFTGGVLLTATATGDSASYILSPSTALVSYTKGLMLLFQAPATVGGALTVNVSGLGARSVKTLSGVDPTAGDILSGDYLLLVYDGVNFVQLSGGGYLAKKASTQSLTGSLSIDGNFSVTGTPTFPTAAVGTNTTQAATTEFVIAERSNAATLTNKTLTAPVINSPTGIVKADVGLSNVDNTSDVNKPISTAQQAALDLKANLASPELTGNPTAPTQSINDNSNKIATTQYVATADAAVLASVGSMLGINFGAFTMIDNELIVTHLTTTTPSIVNGDLILTYETL